MKLNDEKYKIKKKNSLISNDLSELLKLIIIFIVISGIEECFLNTHNKLL